MKFNFDYIKNKNIIFAVSFLVVIAGLIYGVVTNYKFDIDFKGGTRIQVDLNEEYTTSEVSNLVKSVTGEVPEIQATSSGNNSLAITTQAISEDVADQIIVALNDNYQNMGEATIKNVQASYGKELLNSSITAVIVSIVLMLIYVAVRFRTLGWTAAVSAVIVTEPAGVTSNALYVAGTETVLTIIGYSINDTIIVYDRIRENKKLVTKSSQVKDTINESINQTMKRTVITSLTTLTAIACVLVFALVKDQETLKQFSIPLAIGIVEGTFSSIFIASNLWYTIDNFVKKLKKA